jgi:DNA helicase HerA-like ATPase
MPGQAGHDEKDNKIHNDMLKDGQLYIAHSDNGNINLVGKMANRHGLIAGATGTGKTVTLQVLAETFSQAGVPCFMADMKGDLSGISQPGKLSGFIEKRMPEFGIENPEFAGCPTRFFDVFGEQGFPMRATVSAMGPQLLARLMELTEVQTGVLNAVFRIADDNNLLLIDLKDLKLMLDFVGKNAAQFTTEYGNIAPASIGAIQRSVLQIESEGGNQFFGEPAFNVEDLFAVENGRGVMNVLAADKLMLNPKLYSTYLLWLMTELYANLPEVGDLELPKFVFFFDEAHMLFDGTSKALVDKIEQVIRLIRSKGVGIYFITQVPSDVPVNVLAQLSNRVQHALRAYTPQDQKAVRAAAQTFRPNPSFKTEEAILDLGTGEALVSFLDEKGAPSVVERAKILFPLSQIGAITPGQRMDIQATAPKKLKDYEKFFDRESAYEVLTEARQKAEEEAEKERKALEKQKEKEAKAKEKEKEKKASSKSKKAGIGRTILGTMIAAAATSFARSAGTRIGKSIGGGSSKKSTSTAKKSTSTTKKSTSTAKKANTATKKAVNTAARKVTTEILKNIFK